MTSARLSDSELRARHPLATPRERPIIFSGESVRAILSGAKTQTRRVVKPQAHTYAGDLLGQPWIYAKDAEGFTDLTPIRCPFGQPGDRLWVRETFTLVRGDKAEGSGVLYRADPMFDGCGPEHIAWKWSSPLHMPRWASRILLEVEQVRVQRVQSISKGDAQAEGFEKTPGLPIDPRDWFRTLWDSLNAKRGHSWESNCWVWAITFRLLRGEPSP